MGQVEFYFAATILKCEKTITGENFVPVLVSRYLVFNFCCERNLKGFAWMQICSWRVAVIFA